MAANTAMPARREVLVDGRHHRVEAREQAPRGQQVRQQVDARLRAGVRARCSGRLACHRRASYQGAPVKMPASRWFAIEVKRPSMRLSQYPINTMKETPAEAEVVSHQLMLRAGLIRRLAAGLYSWLPLGLRVLQKVEHIIREEMNRAGALELVMPVVQPARAVAGIGPLERVRTGAAAHQGPARARLRRRTDPRGSDHRHRAARAQELPPAAGELLPDPDQVPRRGAAALRCHARARVHHEGRLLLPCSTRPRSQPAIGPCTTPTRASSRAPGSPSARCAPTPARSAGTSARSFTCSPQSGRGCDRVLRWR